MLRIIMMILLIGGQIGIGIIDLCNKNWRIGCVAMLIAICNTLVFWPAKDIPV